LSAVCYADSGSREEVRALHVRGVERGRQKGARLRTWLLYEESDQLPGDFLLRLERR
jgi:hypothetical protein